MKYLLESSSGITMNSADFSLQNFSASMAVSKHKICSISESKKAFNRDNIVESTDAMAWSAELRALPRKINPHLLCDLLTHEKFPDFMSNIEMFIYELAENCFYKMNREISQTYDFYMEQDLPPEQKKHLATLKAGAIQSDRYFKAVVYEDLDGMMEELRKKQRNNEKDPYHTLQKAEVQTQVKQ